MKVLLLTNHLNTGGITAYLLNLVRGFSKRSGVDFWVASRGGELEQEFINAGACILRIPLTTKCEASPKVGISFLRLSKIFREEKFDLIHAQTRLTQVLAALLSRRFSVPFISTCHGYFKVRLTRRLFPCWGKGIIAVSDQVRDHLIADFGVKGEQIGLIYNGVDLSQFHPVSDLAKETSKKALGFEPSQRLVGHIGRLSVVKGQKFLIEAAGRLRSKFSDVKFLLIGDGPERSRLLELVRKNGLEDIFFIRESVSDTSQALQAMDVFVMPSLQEGLGLSLLEAQAQGVPVVASSVGGILSVVRAEETGLLVPVADASALADAIERLLRERSLAQSLAKAALARIERIFSLDDTIRKTEEFYKGMVYAHP